MDSLDRKRLFEGLMSNIRGNKRRTPSPHGMAAMRGGAYAPMEMSQTVPTAQDRQALNERSKNRALYGKYGQGGLMREQMGLKERLEKAGLANERELQEMRNVGKTRVADIRRSADIDTERMRQKGLTGRQEGVNALTRRQQDLQYGPEGVERIKAGKEPYHYQPLTGPLGQTTGVQVYQGGKPIGGDQPAPDLSWAKELDKGQFEHAAGIVEREISGLSPEEQRAYADEIFKRNPAFGRYMAERQPPKKTSPKKEKESKVQQNRRGTLGDVLTDTSAFRTMGNQLIRNLDAPNRLFRGVMNTQMPDWLR